MGLPRGLLELCGHLGAVLPRGHERPSLQATSLPLTQCPAVLQQPPTPLPPPHTLPMEEGAEAQLLVQSLLSPLASRQLFFSETLLPLWTGFLKSLIRKPFFLRQLYLAEGLVLA